MFEGRRTIRFLDPLHPWPGKVLGASFSQPNLPFKYHVATVVARAFVPFCGRGGLCPNLRTRTWEMASRKAAKTATVTTVAASHKENRCDDPGGIQARLLTRREEGQGCKNPVPQAGR